MPGADPVTSVADAVTSIGNLVDGILTRADRDGPTKTYEADVNNVQNSFARADPDEQWAHAYRLYAAVGHPFTPGLVGKDGERQFKFNSLLIAAELKYAKAIIARLVAQRVKE